MVSTFTARYIKTDSGYMGQIIEWPEVVTEGVDLEDCRASLKDALEQMILAQRDLGLGEEIPEGHALFEPPYSVESISGTGYEKMINAPHVDPL